MTIDALDSLNAMLLACRRCPRLVAWREKVACEKRRAYRNWDYWGRPVPGFGDPAARLLVVGLAPGAHGSNRTGRQFTGDASGDFLYPALHRAGFASRPESVSRNDDLELRDLYIAAVCRCAPPGNRPTAQEMANCQPYLEWETAILRPKVFVALGRIAFDAILRLVASQPGPRSTIHPRPPLFAHGAIFELPGGRRLLCSYHPSRQNTQTGRLTPEMFDRIWQIAHRLLDEH
jgi:uracil-DNA glycosylase family 4